MVENFKLNLRNQLNQDYGLHRYGWKFALSGFFKMNSNPDGTLLDSFIERTFAWERDKTVYEKDWIGFIHNAPNAPSWYDPPSRNQNIIKSVEFKSSLRHCRGLFTLSKYHRDKLLTMQGLPKDLLIDHLKQPVNLNVSRQFDFFHFKDMRVKRIVEVGFWLRKRASFHRLKSDLFKKFRLCKCDDSIRNITKECIRHECGEETSIFLDSDVHILNTLSDEEYDELISSSVLFADLYDSSANNLVVEAIAYNTPLLINNTGGVSEYLGAKYPFYFSDIFEASKKVNDLGCVRAAHEYLRDECPKEHLSLSHFIDGFLGSEIYQQL